MALSLSIHTDTRMIWVNPFKNKMGKVLCKRHKEFVFMYFRSLSNEDIDETYNPVLFSPFVVVEINF